MLGDSNDATANPSKNRVRTEDVTSAKWRRCDLLDAEKRSVSFCFQRISRARIALASSAIRVRISLQIRISKRQLHQFQTVNWAVTCAFARRSRYATIQPQ
jgi:hypothetical protein